MHQRKTDCLEVSQTGVEQKASWKLSFGELLEADPFRVVLFAPVWDAGGQYVLGCRTERFGYFCGTKVTWVQCLRIIEKEGFIDWIPYQVRNDGVEGEFFGLDPESSPG